VVMVLVLDQCYRGVTVCVHVEDEVLINGTDQLLDFCMTERGSV
jgi:hypothetical protein